MASSVIEIDLHMKDVMKKVTLVVNLKGVKTWQFRKNLAMIHLRIIAWLLGVGIRVEE